MKGRLSADVSDSELLERFVTHRDESAFATLVVRHGPMVWGVCRRVLQCHQDAEDAFQATFLVLVRKAASILPREMLGNWLYGVAFQTAVRVRSMNIKRRARERQVEGITEPAAIPEGIWSDLRPLLDRALSRLPDKYRVAVVLCDLEGKTYQQSAQQIGCPAGTFAARLARGRTMLAKRLARYGLAMSGGMLATVLSEKAASAGVPTSALSSTIKAASLFAAGQAATTGAISVKVVALTERVLKTMLLTKLKVVLVPLGVAALVGAAGLIYQTQAQPSRTVTATEEKENESQPMAKNPFRPQPEVAVKKELEKLQDTWIGVGGEFRGKGEPEENSRRAGHRLVIADDKFAWKTALQEEALMEGTVTIDPTKRPKTMDMLFDREGKRAVGRCIYELDGDTLKLCYGEPDRPSAFKTKPDSDHRLYIWTREQKTAAKDGEKNVKDADKPKVEATEKDKRDRREKEERARKASTKAGRKDQKPLRRDSISSSDALRGQWKGEKNGIKVDLTLNGEKAHWQVEFVKTRKPKEPYQSPDVKVGIAADLRCVPDVEAGRWNLYLPLYLGNDKEFKEKNPVRAGRAPVGEITRGAEGAIQLRIVPTGHEDLDHEDYDYPAVESLRGLAVEDFPKSSILATAPVR